MSKSITVTGLTRDGESKGHNPKWAQVPSDVIKGAIYLDRETALNAGFDLSKSITVVIMQED